MLHQRLTSQRDLLLALGYIAAFLLLDWVSFIHPFRGLNITPWNPQPALAIALLLNRPRWIPLVWLGLVLADVAVRGFPASWLANLSATAAMALTYAAIARVAQVKLDKTLPLDTRLELYWFTCIVVGGALLAATVYVATVATAAIGSPALIAEAIGRYWIGDAVGLLVTFPMLAMFMNSPRRAALASTLQRADTWIIGAAVVALVFLVFGVNHSDSFKYFYVVLLPVVWAAARMGLAGAVLVSAVTQISLIVAIRSWSNPDLTVFELQMLMAAVAMTGLILGVAVDERERAAAELKGSLRLAAAGEMAAALAHELGQPLTALNNYAEASQALASTPGISDQERLRLLSEISSRMAADAMRASDVVKRLRDFFRTGSTQLQRVGLSELFTEALAASRRRADALGVELRATVDDRTPPVLVDRVQITVVLRNMLANALDAVSSAEPPRQVELRAGVKEATVLVEVLDNGAGIPDERLQGLFEPGSSQKPGGMGVGLSICRAIVEAHGGALWVQPGPGGHLCFTIPAEQPQYTGRDHAP